MSPPRPRSARATTRLLAALCLVATPVVAQQLTQLVPSEAYSLMYASHDADMAFVEESGARVWEAIREARLHEVVLGVLEANQVSETDVQQIESLINLVSTLVGDVAWHDLVANEMVYAELPQPAIPGLPPGVYSYLCAFRPDLANVPDLERSLVSLLDGAANLTDELSLVEEVRPSDPPTRVHSLTVGGYMPVLQFAVRGDVIVAAFGNGAFTRALDLLEGRSDDALVNTPRYRNAVGEVAEQASQFVYFDVERLIDTLFDQLSPQLVAMSGNDWRVRGGLDDLRQVIDFVDTSVTAVHAEGHTLVSECWTRYDPAAVASGNPLFQSFARPADISELLDYVPANATSFSAHGGIDLRPLYSWALGRVKAYVPDAGDALVMYDGAQALLDLSVEDDVLSWLGSESITITLPARRPRPGAGDDMIRITRLRDPEGAKKVIARIENVYAAVVPPLLKRLENERGQTPVIPRIELSEAGGSFPSLKRLSVSFSVPGSPFPIPSIPEFLVGVIGNQLVITTSEDALLQVMDVAAGEIDGVWDHPAMLEGRLPQGPATSCSFVPIGRNIEHLTQAVAMGGGAVTMMMSAMASNEPQLEHVSKLIADTLPRVLSIIRAFDFLKDEVVFSQSRNDGLVSYSRKTVRYTDTDR